MVQLLTSDGLTADLIQGPLAGGAPLVQPPLDADVEVTHNLVLLPGFLPQLDPAPELGLLVAVASSGTGNRVMVSP